MGHLGAQLRQLNSNGSTIGGECVKLGQMPLVIGPRHLEALLYASQEMVARIEYLTTLIQQRKVMMVLQTVRVTILQTSDPELTQVKLLLCSLDLRTQKCSTRNQKSGTCSIPDKCPQKGVAGLQKVDDYRLNALIGHHTKPGKRRQCQDQISKVVVSKAILQSNHES